MPVDHLHDRLVNSAVAPFGIEVESDAVDGLVDCFALLAMTSARLAQIRQMVAVCKNLVEGFLRRAVVFELKDVNRVRRLDNRVNAPVRR